MLDVLRMSVDYCKSCNEGHHLVDGLCWDCRKLDARYRELASTHSVASVRDEAKRLLRKRGA